MIDVIVGCGEVGSTICKLLKEANINVISFDALISNMLDSCNILHICFPYSEKFVAEVMAWVDTAKPREIVIHSTVKVGTTQSLQDLLETPVVFSPIRGVHARMLTDLRRYTKCYTSYYKSRFPFLFCQEMEICGVTLGWWKNPKALELAKLLMDTSYYGWLIVFAQHVKCLALEYGVDEKQLWKFTEEIHGFLGNRPIMFSGEGIGGHCLLPNLELLDDDFLSNIIRSHDEQYRKGGCNKETTT